MEKFYVHFEEDGNPFPFTTVCDPAKLCPGKPLTIDIILKNFCKKFNKKYPLPNPLNPSSISLLSSPSSSHLLTDSSLGELSSGADIFVISTPSSSSSSSSTSSSSSSPSPVMLTCHHSACGEKYDPTKNHERACRYHPGAAVFHDGLKGWECCQKRVSTFSDFLNITGCSWGLHSNEKPALPDIKETGPSGNGHICSGVSSSGTDDAINSSMAKSVPLPEDVKSKEVEDPLQIPDDPSAVIPLGAPCLHRGCEKKYKSEECRCAPCEYHPGSPLFHEGLKGWTCCKKRVIDFDDFLGIRGCTTGLHKFVPPPTPKNRKVECRHDFYESNLNVNMTIYAKKVVKDESSITFHTKEIDVVLAFPDGAKFEKTYKLLRDINPSTSKFSIGSVRVDLTLHKMDEGVEWNDLERN